MTEPQVWLLLIWSLLLPTGWLGFIGWLRWRAYQDRKQAREMALRVKPGDRELGLFGLSDEQEADRAAEIQGNEHLRDYGGTVKSDQLHQRTRAGKVNVQRGNGILDL